MGFIGKIFGAIFGFIGAIFGAVGKVLGIGGKSDYYVELDSDQSAASESAPESAKETTAKVADPSPATKVETTTKGESAPQAKSKASSQAASSSGKAKAKGKDEEVEQAQPATQPPSDPIDVIVAAVSKPTSSVAGSESHQQNGKAGEEVTFAPEQLLTLSSTGSRRRPGPSLSPFKVMARQVQRSN